MHDQPTLDAIDALRARAAMLIAEDRIAEAEAILAEVAKAIVDYETRHAVRLLAR